MIPKASIFLVFFAFLLIVGNSAPALAAQLDVRLNPQSKDSEFTVRYQRTVFIEYPEGGDLADMLRGNSWSIEKSADTSTPGISNLISKLNQKLLEDGSSSRITNLDVEYFAKMTARGLNTSVDYQILLTGTLSDYIIREYVPGGSSGIVDASWRGLTVDGPIVIDGTEINLPISALQSQQPGVYSLLLGTEAEDVLMVGIINADGIRDQPLTNWHFLFDPTGINVDASQFGLSEDITGFVVSIFTMGESSFREGQVREKVWEAEIILDKRYEVRGIESADAANFAVIGFGAIDNIEGAEVLGVTPTPPEGYATTSTGEFPVMIMYGMAGMAAIGAVAILFISQRKLKGETYEQTGIDPSRLTGYQTSAGAGGYQTNRGEAQLKDGGDYQRTKSVYEEEKKEEPAIDTKKKGALPKGF